MIDGARAVEATSLVREERDPVGVVGVDRGVVVAAVVVQVGRQVHQPVLVSLRFADVDGAPGQVDVVAVKSAGLAGSQAQAVDHPEDRRDDQVPRPAVGGGHDLVGGVEDRPQFRVGVQVGVVADLLAWDARRDQVGVHPEPGHVFGQLPRRGDPRRNCPVDVLAPGRLMAQRIAMGRLNVDCLGILGGAHRVESAQVSLRGCVRVPERMLEVEQAADVDGQAADQPGHG